MAVTYIIAPERIADGLGDEIYDIINGRVADRRRALQFAGFLEDFIFDDGEIYEKMCKKYEEAQEELAARGFNVFIPCCENDEGYVALLISERR